MVTRNIIRLISVCCAMMISSSLFAGRYIKIENIDASSDFPKIRVFLTIAGLSDADEELLDENAISVYEDGRKNSAAITLQKRIESENYLYLVFSIDSSKSISRKILDKIKSSAREMADCIGPNDKIAVYRFDDDVRLINDFTGDTREIIRNIKHIERHGNKTLLYDSIYDSIELFDKVDQINKKIIVFTDGKDEGSSVSEEDVITYARHAAIPVYFICFKNSNNIKVMARISKLTGGKLIYSNSHDDVAGMYRTVLSVMKNRYIAAYASTLKQDGARHRIEIRLKHGDISDRDTELIHIDKSFLLTNIFTRNNCALIVLGLLFLMTVFFVVMVFMYRERKMLKNRLELEKKIALKSSDEEFSVLESDMALAKAPPVPVDAEGRHVNAWLFKKEGPDAGKKIQITSPVFTIGSGKDNNVIIQDELVSPHHARITNMQGSLYLYDLISDNGLYLNGRKMLRPRELHDWDEIRIGNIVMIFRNATPSN